ncbi:MAG: 2'-5' RNA ligase [Firmicutes bacterium]|nr:2'-5' RNA ligase [Bacillota bacterium]
MMSRKLASIQKIWKIEPIEGADRIELAHVLGWQCVVNKGQFQPMDLAVYFEIDSFLPIRPEFEFMRASSYKKSDILGEGFRLKTMKFRGQISQGLLLPVSDFAEIPSDAELGLNVTETLGVRKWEVEERATTGGTVIGNLPRDIPHTDETRVQANPELIQAFAEIGYYISTKMDGSSHSIGLDEDGFHVTGHNYEYKDDGTSSFYNFVKERGYREKLEAFAKREELTTFTVQGELCAPGIQQNRLKLTKPEWYVFTVRENGKRVGLYRMLSICEELGFAHVPIEEIDVNLPEKYPTVEALLARADGEYPNGGKKEGIVIRPVEPIFNESISAALSMKVVNNKYLLKNID